jgi:homoprotocatechuate degradation regulator HpaR
MGPIRDMLSQAGITEQQWRVLRVLEESGPSDPTHIAEQACLLLPSLTRILQKLEDKHLIRRQKHERDGRRQVIHLEQSGRNLIEANLGTNLALIEDLRQQMGTDRYEALLDLLSELDQTTAKSQLD